MQFSYILQFDRTFWEIQAFKKIKCKKFERRRGKIPWLTQPPPHFALHVMKDPQSLESYRKQLQELLDEIEGYLAKTEQSAEAVSPDKSLGRLSRMEAMQDQQLILEARRRKKMQKVAVLSALQRIEHGQFGTCIYCNKPIAHERLEVAPESNTCVSCS